MTPPHLRRARVAATVMFATNGALPATLLARYAEVKAELGVNAAVFGLLVASYALGAALTLHLPGVLVRRWGSRTVSSIGTICIVLAMLVAVVGIVAHAPWLFALGLGLAGFADVTVDVAQNAQGIRVQQAYGRSLLSSMHGGWSIGAAAGGAVGTLAAIAGVPLVVHLAVWGALCIASVMIAGTAFLADDADGDAEASSSGRIGGAALRLLAPLAVVALVGLSVEDVGNNWSAVLLSSERGMAAATAGVGLTALIGAQFVGRMFGDRFVDRLGSRAALGTSLAVVVVGLSLAAWAPGIPLTLVGLVVAGLGCAVMIPQVFAEADALPGLPPHAGVTWVSWVMRLGSVAVSPAIGGVANLSSLPIALTGVAGLALIALIIMGGRAKPRSVLK